MPTRADGQSVSVRCRSTRGPFLALLCACVALAVVEASAASPSNPVDRHDIDGHSKWDSEPLDVEHEERRRWFSENKHQLSDQEKRLFYEKEQQWKAAHNVQSEVAEAGERQSKQQAAGAAQHSATPHVAPEQPPSDDFLFLEDAVASLQLELSEMVETLDPEAVLNRAQANEVEAWLVLFYAPNRFPSYDFKALLTLWADVSTLLADGRIDSSNHVMDSKEDVKNLTMDRILISRKERQLLRGVEHPTLRLGIVDGVRHAEYTKRFFAPLRVRRTYRLHPSVSQKLELDPAASEPDVEDGGDNEIRELKAAMENPPVLFFPILEGYAPMYFPAHLLRVVNASVHTRMASHALKEKSEKGADKFVKKIAGPADPMSVIRFLQQEDVKLSTLSTEENHLRRARFMRAVGPPHMWNRHKERELKRKSLSMAIPPVAHVEDEEDEGDLFVEGIPPLVDRDEVFAQDFTPDNAGKYWVQREKALEDKYDPKRRQRHSEFGISADALRAQLSEREAARGGRDDGEKEDVSPAAKAQLDALTRKITAIDVELTSQFYDAAHRYFFSDDIEDDVESDDSEDVDPATNILSYYTPGRDRKEALDAFMRDLKHYQMRKEQEAEFGRETKKQEREKTRLQQLKWKEENEKKQGDSVTEEQRQAIAQEYKSRLVVDYLHKNQTAHDEYHGRELFQRRRALSSEIEAINNQEQRRRLREGTATAHDHRAERHRVMFRQGLKNRRELYRRGREEGTAAYSAEMEVEVADDDDGTWL